jgi:UDP-N-acetyl-D-galactosamine dehydrogenase
MNELSIIFNRMGIDTKAVLEAAGTKWNFLKFSPGLVGGHCIGVDPYYLTYKAEQLGYHSQIILSGRRINDDMGRYVAEHVVKNLISVGSSVKDAKVAVLGFTFKENCPDTRNTKVIDIITELREYGIDPLICDPVADAQEAVHLYNITFTSLTDLKELDALIVAVAHEEFQQLSLDNLNSYFVDKQKVVVDVKSLFNRQELEQAGFTYWSL